jgi:hypothetical protein
MDIPATLPSRWVRLEGGQDARNQPVIEPRGRDQGVIEGVARYVP